MRRMIEFKRDVDIEFSDANLTDLIHMIREMTLDINNFHGKSYR